MVDDVEDARVARTRTDVARTVLTILRADGWDGVSHSAVARAAGYSKTTLYTHWPRRSDLFRVAVESLDDMRHCIRTGNVRADLVDELIAYRTAVVTHRVDHLLSVMASLGASAPEIIATRDRVVADGESVVRDILQLQCSGVRLDAAVHMVTGSVLCPTVMHGNPPTDEIITAAVDILLRGVHSS